MKAKRYLPILAAMVFGITGLSAAQTEGYYGQQAAAGPSVQSQLGSVPAMFTQSSYTGGGEGYYGQTTPLDMSALKLGNEGQITLEKATRVGNATLLPGIYEVRHRRSVNGHFVEFTRVIDNTGEGGLSPSPYDYQVAAKVPCSIQPLNTLLKRTSAKISTDAGARLTSLKIGGENVVHVLDAGDPSAPQNIVEYGGGGM